MFEDEDNNNEPEFNVLGSSKYKAKTQWSYEIIIFLIELQKLVIEYIPQKDLPILTEHKRGDIMFRGHPNFHGEGSW